jgi:hypothetical protein
MTIFRPKISELTVQQLHRLAIRDNRSMTSMAEIALRTGLRAMQNLPRPWESEPGIPIGGARDAPRGPAGSPLIPF